MPVSPTAAERQSANTCDSIEVYTRRGCPHCGRALTFIAELKARHPAVTVQHYDLTTDIGARERLIALSLAHELERVAVPTFRVCETVIVGFDSAATTGFKLAGLLGLKTGGAPGLEAAGAELPLFGRVTVHDLGLPLFTFVVGLVDGFNPCAMWVLLFLLSLLVHVRSRLRIVLIAGTFVIVSGLVYFAFMAAWLNAFLIIGLSRALQVTVGIMALLIGAMHGKDFLATGTGPSLSIPDSARPGIYSRVRRIVQAEDLKLAMIGVTLLAVVVNLVELLCTAGLPALYTQILVSQNLGMTAYYGYLLLYNAAYVLDDALIVGIAVYTLSQTRLQVRQGRWLKLASALVIIALGLVLLLAPEHLLLAF